MLLCLRLDFGGFLYGRTVVELNSVTLGTTWRFDILTFFYLHTIHSTIWTPSINTVVLFWLRPLLFSFSQPFYSSFSLDLFIRTRFVSLLNCKLYHQSFPERFSTIHLFLDFFHYTFRYDYRPISQKYWEFGVIDLLIFCSRTSTLKQTRHVPCCFLGLPHPCLLRSPDYPVGLTFPETKSETKGTCSNFPKHVYFLCTTLNR